MMGFSNSFHKKFKKLINRSGLSLVEVLIAMAIFAIGVLGIMALQGIALMSTDFSGNMTYARLLASDQIERLGGFPFTASALDACGFSTWCHKDSGNGMDGAQANLDNMGQATATGRFRREWDVVTVTPAVKQVTVRVQWSDSPGVTNAQAGSYNRSLSVTSIQIDPS